MERMHKSAVPMWMDLSGNIEGEAAPFPGHLAKLSNLSNSQHRAPDGPRWNGVNVPQCTSSQSESDARSATNNKYPAATKPNHETTQHILEEMLRELDREPLITFSSLDGPPNSMSRQHIASAAPLDTRFLHVNRSRYDQNQPVIPCQGYYNSGSTFQNPSLVSSSACRYELSRQTPVRYGTHIDAVRHAPLMSRDVNKPACDIVTSQMKVQPMINVPSQMTRSLLELARLVDNPPVFERNVFAPVAQGYSLSTTQEDKTLRNGNSVKATASAKITQELPPNCPKPKTKGSSDSSPPNSKPKEDVTQKVPSHDSYKDSRHKITTKHVSVFVNQHVVTVMNVNQSGRLTRSPAVVLERLHEDKLKSLSYQPSNKRRRTQSTQLLSYVGDSDSDTENDSSASDYVPSECDRNSHTEELDGSEDSTLLDSRELEANLESDYLESSSDSADFTTCGDDDDSRDEDDEMSSQGDAKIS